MRVCDGGAQATVSAVTDPVSTSAFELPDRLAAKADPTLIAADERHFADIAARLDDEKADLAERLAVARRQTIGEREGQEGMERDQEIYRLSSRLRTLRRFGLDLCLGHIVREDDPEPVYIGRLGLTDTSGRQLVIDWRAPAAKPFFGATHADPMGLTSRRRYHWTRGRVSDYWDEVFATGEFEGHAAALDDQSAFIASLGSSRSPQMRDVLATIAADQDGIIRAESRGALVVDGGPGTGKTVVALHRAAYLLYADPRLGHRRGGLLFVGPHQPYLNYVADVLPSLGEEGVQICTLRQLNPEGATATIEADPEVARLKSLADMVNAIEPAVRLYEEPPKEALVVQTDVAELLLSPADWAWAFDAADPGTPHNEARDQVWDEVLTILIDQSDDPDDESREQLRASLLRNDDLVAAFNRAWPLLEPTELVGDLWTVPAYLKMCAPWLDPQEVRLLQRATPDAWTVSDLPLLDAARQRLGDPDASRRRRHRELVLADQREEMDRVIEHLISSDDTEMLVMSMLRGADMQVTLEDDSGLAGPEPDMLAGPFAHIVVDEAQELTDAEWQMLLLRCPSGSFTIVGDRAQARHGFAESWEERLTRIGLDRVGHTTLSINYRTPEEVMREAEPVIRAALPDANVPTSIRSNGIPVRRGTVTELGEVLAEWLAHAEGEGIGCVITTGTLTESAMPDTTRIRCLTPELAKGLEFDLVVLIDPADFGDGIEGAVDRYVAMTRATQQLVILTTGQGSIEDGDDVGGIDAALG